jgi:hypothetical protein
MANRPALLTTIAAALLASSCGGGGPSSAPPAPATTLSAFITQFCDVYRPCCAAAGRPTSGASCRDSLTNFPTLFFPPTYDPAAGETCLAALRDAATQPGFCDATAVKPVACDPAFGQTGTVAPGAACNFDNDCTPSAEGRVVCAQPNLTRACQIQIRGQAGDGPCVWTVDVGIYDYSGPLLADGLPRGYLCYLADGLYCDGGTGVCSNRKAAGESCGTTGAESCVDSAACDYAIAAGTCAARKAADATCAVNGEDCVKGTYCSSASATCALQLPFGAACTTSSACQSGNCFNGTCGEGPASELGFLCGGG